MLHIIKQSIAKYLACIKWVSSLWQTLEKVYADQTNNSHMVEIFKSLLTYKQGDLSLQAHFGCLHALLQEVDPYQPPTPDLVTLKRYHEALSSICVGFVSPSHLKLRDLFSLVTMSLASLSVSLLLFESRLERLPPISFLLQAI